MRPILRSLAEVAFIVMLLTEMLSPQGRVPSLPNTAIILLYFVYVQLFSYRNNKFCYSNFRIGPHHNANTEYKNVAYFASHVILCVQEN